MLNKEKIEQLISAILAENDIAKYRISIITTPQLTLEICIKKSDGTMDLDTCEKISNLISQILDENDIGDTQYTLDVCSFGAEEVLETLAEVSQHIDDYLHVELYNPTKGVDQFEGYLRSVNDNQLSFEYLLKNIKKKIDIDYENIKLIRLAVKF
ncbi:MAG: ribosome maturation factor RimP [Erysipelotrichaceae bacterium]